MARPAGYSSDEDFSDFDDDDYSSYTKPTKTCSFQPKVLTPDEKLIDAIINDDLPIARKALEEGANVHFRDFYSNYYTPILMAAKHGSFEIMKLLINAGANVNDDYQMYNTLMCVCDSTVWDKNVLLDCLTLLLDNGADPQTTDWVGSTPLINAVRQNQEPLALKLINSGCPVNKPNSDGWTPLFYAVENQNKSMAELLIKNGGSIDQLDRHGTALMDIASSGGNDQELIELVTPLHLKVIPDEDTTDYDYLLKSQYQTIIYNAPKKEHRMFGFHEDAVHFIRGIGLEYVADIMKQKNVQLAELLTWGKEDFNRIGIEMSFHTNKIKYCVRKYHEREWGKGSLPQINSVVTDEKVDSFYVLQVLLTYLRICHINSASTLYLLQNHDDRPAPPKLIKEVQNVLYTTNIIQKQLAILRAHCNILKKNTLVPPDLIASEISNDHSKYSYKYFAFGCVVCVSFYKCRLLRTSVGSVIVSILNFTSLRSLFLKTI